MIHMQDSACKYPLLMIHEGKWTLPCTWISRQSVIVFVSLSYHSPYMKGNHSLDFQQDRLILPSFIVCVSYK